MRTRRYNILQRIFIKANSALYTVVGKMVDALTRAGMWDAVDYKVAGHYGDVIQVVHDYPKNYEPANKAAFNEWKSYDTFPHDLFRIDNAWLTSDGIVLKKHRTFIKTLPHPIFRYQYGVLYNTRMRLFYGKEKAERNTKYILYYDNWSWNNYYHWIIDGLCRVQLVNDHVTVKFTVVLPEKSPAYLTETLRLYGYTDFIYLPEHSRVQLAELYSMNYAAWSGQQHPEILRKMAQTVKQKLAIAVMKPARKIYVSRGKQFSRRVVNEKDVIARLEQHGFETVYFEGKSFREQVELMNTASHLVTSHGANMTNLVFMQSGVRILELINDRKPNFCYWSVAASMGFDYYYQLCPLSIADHIHVDIAELEKNLKLIGI